MHNLTGIFVSREEEQVVDGTKFHSFSVIYPNKREYYLSEKEEEVITWISKISNAIGYTNLTDIYQVKVNMLINHFRIN